MKRFLHTNRYESTQQRFIDANAVVRRVNAFLVSFALLQTCVRRELALSSHILADARLINWSGDLLRLFGEDAEIGERSLENGRPSRPRVVGPVISAAKQSIKMYNSLTVSLAPLPLLGREFSVFRRRSRRETLPLAPSRPQ